MSGFLQFVLLLLIMGVVFFLGYRRGKTIKERELKDMEMPELTPDEERKARFKEFAAIFDEIMSEE